jgi:hypothetical protein
MLRTSFWEWRSREIREVRKLWLNQRKYIEIVLKCFNMQDCKPVKVPIPVGEKLTVEQCPKTQEEIEDMAHVFPMLVLLVV